MKPRVYIETTIASAYHETRSDAETVARRNWTRRWWDTKREEVEAVTSDAVVDELEAGEYPHQAEALEMIRGIPQVPFNEQIADIVAAYIQHRVMPANPNGDALHLALASYHRCDFLVTWNCRHIANANKFAHIRRINDTLGLFVPTLITPLELLAEGVTP